MGERQKPRVEIIHPQVEILPPGHSEPQSSVGGSRVWLSVDSHGGTRRIYVAKPRPFTSLLLILAFGVLLTVSFVVALGVMAIVVGVTAVALAGVVVYGLIRGAIARLR